MRDDCISREAVEKIMLTIILYIILTVIALALAIGAIGFDWNDIIIKAIISVIFALVFALSVRLCSFLYNLDSGINEEK